MTTTPSLPPFDQKAAAMTLVAILGLALAVSFGIGAGTIVVRPRSGCRLERTMHRGDDNDAARASRFLPWLIVFAASISLTIFAFKLLVY
jgi:hypothetical protein